MNANPLADALHPDAIYRVAIDNDEDLLNDIAFSYVFSEPKDGKQTVDVYLAANDEAEEVEAVGEKIFSNVPVSFVGDEPYIATSGDFTFFAGARSDAFFFDFDGVKQLFDTSGKRNFTDLTLPGESPWTGVDSNTQANVFSTAIEMPTSFLGADPDIRIWAAAAYVKTASSFTSTAPDTRRSAASSTPMTPRRSTTPACRCTTGSGGSTCSSISWAIPAATAATKPSQPSIARAPCPTC